MRIENVTSIGIVEADDFSSKALELLAEHGTVSLYDSEKQTLESFIEDKDTLFIRLRYFWGEDLFKAAPKLRYLCTPTTGMTHIDMEYAANAGIEVLSLKGETEFLKTISATPEHTFGLAIALLRNYGHAFLRSGICDSGSPEIVWNRDSFKGFEMKDLRAGIIGMGRVGSILSGYLSAFGVKTSYFDIRSDIENPHGAARTDSIISLIDASDMVFLCASYEEKNRNMIDSSILERMKGKHFINTARGELVDEDALLQLIRDGNFAGVALDVLTGEPGPTRAAEFAALMDRYNVIITPHIGGATYTSMRETEEFVARKLAEKLNMD